MKLTKNILIDNQFVATAVGIESYADQAATESVNGTRRRTSPIDDLRKIQAQFAPETIQKLSQELNGRYRIPYSKSIGISRDVKDKAYEMDTQNAITKYAQECVSNDAVYKFLPNEVRKRVHPLKDQYDKYTKALASMESSDEKYFEYKWKKDQYKQALESLLFNIISGVDGLYRKGFINQDGYPTSTAGTEDVGRYQFAVYYPVYETTTQWINCASTVYPKLVQVKDFANLYSSIPVHFMKVEVEWRDEAGNVVDRMPREALYSKFIPKKKDAYQSNTKRLVVKKADFNKQIDLHTTILDGMSAPFLGPLDYVRSDFQITDIKLADGKTYGELYDYRSGTALTKAMHEIDRKGKTFEVVFDKTQKDKYYSIGLYFDGIRHILKFFYVKSESGMQDIDEIHFKFAGNDPHLQYKWNMGFNIIEEQFFLEAGDEITWQIPVNADEYAFIDGRRDGNYLTQQLNATAENEANMKEAIFFEGLNDMILDVRKQYEIERTMDVEDVLREGNGSVLYAYQSYDLQTRDTIRKEENLNFALAPTFETLRNKLDIASNSKMHTQLNMLTSSYSLPVLSSAHKAVIGDVNETDNGKFLGVAQTSRTYILTIGSLKSGSAVNGVIVGSDKAEVKPDGYEVDGKTMIPTHEIVYKYIGLPTFADANITTFSFNQTATRIINTGDIRLNINPLLAGMKISTSGKFQVIRKAVAEVEITGHHIREV